MKSCFFLLIVCSLQILERFAVLFLILITLNHLIISIIKIIIWIKLYYCVWLFSDIWQIGIEPFFFFHSHPFLLKILINNTGLDSLCVIHSLTYFVCFLCLAINFNLSIVKLKVAIITVYITYQDKNWFRLFFEQFLLYYGLSFFMLWSFCFVVFFVL